MMSNPLTKTFLIALAVIFLMPAICWAQDDVMHGAKMKVTSVVNGQEIQGVLENGQEVTVRIMGIDCPTGKAGKKALKIAKRLMKGKTVTLESTNEHFPLLLDNRNRLVAYVQLPNGEDLASSILEKGSCTGEMWSMNHPRQTEYATLSK